MKNNQNEILWPSSQFPGVRDQKHLRNLVGVKHVLLYSPFTKKRNVVSISLIYCYFYRQISHQLTPALQTFPSPLASYCISKNIYPPGELLSQLIWRIDKRDDVPQPPITEILITSSLRLTVITRSYPHNIYLYCFYRYKPIQ